jgi:HK97 family phage major capsid protein
MNSTTAGILRKFKDHEGRYVWQESVSAGQPSTLLGYAVEIDEQMPDVAAGQFPIAFGDWKRAYLVIDHSVGTRVLRDEYTEKPWVKFYTTKRLGGSVQDFHAFKLLKVSG